MHCHDDDDDDEQLPLREYGSGDRPALGLAVQQPHQQSQAPISSQSFTAAAFPLSVRVREESPALFAEQDFLQPESERDPAPVRR